METVKSTSLMNQYTCYNNILTHCLYTAQLCTQSLQYLLCIFALQCIQSIYSGHHLDKTTDSSNAAHHCLDWICSRHGTLMSFPTMTISSLDRFFSLFQMESFLFVQFLYMQLSHLHQNIHYHILT